MLFAQVESAVQTGIFVESVSSVVLQVRLHLAHKVVVVLRTLYLLWGDYSTYLLQRDVCMHALLYRKKLIY